MYGEKRICFYSKNELGKELFEDRITIYKQAMVP